MHEQRPTLSGDEILILEAAEDDYRGLFTANWDLRYRGRAQPDTVLNSRAQQAIHSLLGHGLIALYRCSGWIGGTQTLLPVEEYAAILSDPKSWEKPERDDVAFVCYAALSAGLNNPTDVTP